MDSGSEKIENTLAIHPDPWPTNDWLRFFTEFWKTVFEMCALQSRLTPYGMSMSSLLITSKDQCISFFISILLPNCTWFFYFLLFFIGFYFWRFLTYNYIEMITSHNVHEIKSFIVLLISLCGVSQISDRECYKLSIRMNINVDSFSPK